MRNEERCEIDLEMFLFLMMIIERGGWHYIASDRYNEFYAGHCFCLKMNFRKPNVIPYLFKPGVSNFFF